MQNRRPFFAQGVSLLLCIWLGARPNGQYGHLEGQAHRRELGLVGHGLVENDRLEVAIGSDASQAGVSLPGPGCVRSMATLWLCKATPK